MGFSFGGFAGGFSEGFNNGVKMGKTLRDVIREAKTQEVLDKAREEAGAAYDAQNRPEAGGLPTSTAPAEKPAEKPADNPEVVATPVPAQEPGEVKTITPGNPYDPSDTRTDPKPVQAPLASPESAAVSQAGATPAVAAPTPTQAAAAGGVPKVTPAPEAGMKDPTKPSPPVASTPAPSPDTAPAAPAAAAKPAEPTVTNVKEQAFSTPRTPEDRAAYIEQHAARAMQQRMIELGDIDGAKKWADWADSSRGKQIISAYAKTTSAPDLESMVQNGMKLYENVNDGVDAKGYKIITKSDGSQVAMVTLYDTKTKKTSEMELTKDGILRLASAANPTEMFTHDRAQKEAADKMKAQAQIKSAEKRQEFKEKAALEEYKADRQDKREQIKSQGKIAETDAKGRNKLSEISLKDQLETARLPEKEKAKVDAKVSVLKDNGWTDDQIKPLIPALVGAGDHKKTTDPTERRALIQSDLAKGDPTWSRKSEADRRKAVDEGMRIVYADEQAAATPTTPAAPAAKPAAPAVSAPPAAAGAKPVYVREKATGKIFRVEGDKMYPVDTPQAGGLPKQ